MNRLALILKAEFNRYLVLMRQYPLEPIANIIVLLILFLIIVSGFKPLQKSVSVGDFNNTVANAMIGYVLWFFVVMALSNFSNKIEEEAKLGTLEQLCMASKSLIWVISGRLITDFVFSSVIIIGLFLLLMTFTNVHLNIEAWFIIPFLLTVLGVYGLGFIMGGLSLVFKRIGEVRAIVQIIFLFLAIVPFDTMTPAFRLATMILPLNLGLEVLRATAVNSRSVIDPEVSHDLFLLTLNSFAYLMVGIFMFRRAEAIARRKGLFAHY